MPANSRRRLQLEVPANSRRGLQRLRHNRNAPARPQQKSGMREYSSLINNYPASFCFLFLAERMANAVNTMSAAQQLRVYLSPIYDCPVKFCFNVDHAAVTAIAYERRYPVPHIQYTLCVRPLGMENYYHLSFLPS